MSRGAPDSVVYREGLFTPAEAAACTGLSPAMQRNWRQAGHLPARTTGVALFSPRDLAMIRLMVVLREVGLGPALSRPVAEEAASSVVWLALADQPETWAVAGPPDEAHAYRQRLEKMGDRHLRDMAGLTGRALAYGVAQGGAVQFFSEIDDETFNADDEVESVIKLRAIAARIAREATQPLFTISPPKR